MMPEHQKLLNLLRKRDTTRLKRVQAAIQRLSQRERCILSEAAVMGYVQGMLAAGVQLSGRVPSDEVIVLRVLDGITTNPDLYPTLSDTTPPEENP